MFLANLMLLGMLFHNAADVSISRLPSITVLFLLGTSDVVDADRSVLAGIQWRSEANWRPGANLKVWCNALYLLHK